MGKLATIINIIVIIILLGFTVNAFFRQQWWIGAFGLFCTVFIIYLIRKFTSPLKEIPLAELVEIYIKSMEKDFKVSLNPNPVFYCDPKEDEYSFRIILQQENEGVMKYYPFEINKFTGKLGNGYGWFTDDVDEVEYWNQQKGGMGLIDNAIKQEINKLRRESVRKQLEHQGIDTTEPNEEGGEY